VRRLVFIAGLLVLLASNSRAAHNPSVAVLDFGESRFAQQTTQNLREYLRATKELQIADVDLARAAAKGIGYAGSLNLSISEARDLGAALATDFYIIGDAQTLRRSAYSRPVYYESYCSLFVVSARTGQLVIWDRFSVDSDQAAEDKHQAREESDPLDHREVATDHGREQQSADAGDREDLLDDDRSA